MTETVTISAEEYRSLLNLKQDMADAQYIARAMAEIRDGAPMLSEAEVDAYLAAPTPLAFWRKRAGRTQANLAGEVGISQPFLALLEAGKRECSVAVLSRVAEVLGVRLDDLVA